MERQYRCLLESGAGNDQTYLHFTVDGIASPDPTCRATARIITPIGASLAVWTIPSHVAGITTNATDDACRKVLSLRAVVFTMANLTTVLTSLVLIVSKGSVERRELSKLVTLELVLAFRDRSGL